MKLLHIAALAASLPVFSITGNFVKDFNHPYVGLVVFYDQNGAFLHRCSGALLTSKVFLTAGHCTDGATSARVYFQQDAGANYNPATQQDPVSGYPDTCATGTATVCTTASLLHNYGFNNFAGFPNTRDAGLVILDNPIFPAKYGKLANAASLDKLAKQRGNQDLTFTASGYGLSLVNPVHFVSFRERLMASSQLVNLGSALTDGFNLQSTGNPGNGKGGTCSGDSGGPVFYGPAQSNTIVAVTSFGLNSNCRGVDFSYRTDTSAVIAWILATVPPAEAALIQFAAID